MKGKMSEEHANRRLLVCSLALAACLAGGLGLAPKESANAAWALAGAIISALIKPLEKMDL